jgi:hypothetical protein
VLFLLTNRTSYGHAPTLDDAKAAFKADYERWQRDTDKITSAGSL